MPDPKESPKKSENNLKKSDYFKLLGISVSLSALQTASGYAYRGRGAELSWPSNKESNRSLPVNTKEELIKNPYKGLGIAAPIR